MEDFDIYADLPDFVWLKKEYEADVEVTKPELPISEKDVIELKTKLLKLEKVHKLVLSHYSSLWKTAKQERKRMERQIADLRSQLDNFAFKRNQRHQKIPYHAVRQPPNPYPSTVVKLPHQFNYPPPLLGQPPFSNQQVVRDVYNYPPPLIQSTVNTNQEWQQEKQQPNEHFVDKLAVSSNVITPENSHSSDESDDGIVKKSEYRSTIYGERLRKKLLEEKRNAARQKKESLLNEKEESHVKSAIVETSNSKPNEFVHAVVPHKEHQELSNENKVDIKNNTENNQITKDQNKTLIGQEKTELDSKNTANTNKSRTDKGLKMQKERDERKREDESRSRQGRETERRRKDEEIEKVKREEFEKRRREEGIDKRRREEGIDKRRKEEEIDKRRKDEEPDRRRKEDLERRREEELRRKKEEEIEKRKKEEKDQEAERRRKDDADRRRGEELRRRKEETDKRRREETEKRKRDEFERKKKEEVDKRRREEIEKRKKEELERKKKDEEIERRKRDELEKKKKEEEVEKRKKEEEQYAKKLKEVEKNKKEKQLEELINERRRIENEMSAMKNEETEEGEIIEPESFDEATCNENKECKKPRDCKEELRENFKENKEHQTNNRKSERSTRSNSSRATNQSRPINDNRRSHRERVNCKPDRYQDDHSYVDRNYNDSRSRRDQLDRDRERRKSSHRNKSRNRRNSTGSHRSDEDKRSHSPKRIKLQKTDLRDKLNDTKALIKDTVKVNSPKRKRPTISDEILTQDCKKRKMSSEEGHDRNIKLSKNDVPKSNASTVQEPVNTNTKNNKTIANSCIKATNDNAVDNSIGITQKENLSESLHKDECNKVVNKSTKSQKEQDRVKDSNKDQVKLSNLVTNKKRIDQANKREALLDELFEVEEKSIDTAANTEQGEKIGETLEDTMLSELEDGEITNMDESTDSTNLPKEAPSKSIDKPVESSHLCGNKSATKSGILFDLLSQTQNNTNKENLKIGLNEKYVNKQETQISKVNSKSETIKEDTNKTENTSQQIKSEIQVFVNKTNHIESTGLEDVKKNILSQVNRNKNISELSDKIITVVENENQRNCTEIDGGMNIDKSVSSILIEKSSENHLKKNNSENQVDSKEKSDIQRTELRNETNSTKNVCLKENIQKHIGQPVVNEPSDKALSKPAVKSESQEDAVQKSVNPSETKVSQTTIKKIIVVRRRRKPVQLSNSSPVVVVNTNADKPNSLD